mgnify:CR=1 FL=1
MTNYEKIKQMTVEEMADVFEMRELFAQFFALSMNGEHGKGKDKRYRCAIEWLESEAE